MATSLTPPPTPPADTPHCPASAIAAAQPEPKAPKGVDGARLLAYLSATFGPAGEAMFQWAFVDHPAWGRALADRADQVRVDCAAMEKATP